MNAARLAIRNDRSADKAGGHRDCAMVAGLGKWVGFMARAGAIGFQPNRSMVVTVNGAIRLMAQAALAEGSREGYLRTVMDVGQMRLAGVTGRCEETREKTGKTDKGAWHLKCSRKASGRGV